MNRIEINHKVPYVLICTYGTLLSEEHNNYLLGDSECLGKYKTENSFTMYGKGSGFPIVSPKGNTSITYELYKITDNDILQDLHNLEGFTGIPNHPNNWYDVTKIPTPYGDAWMYVQNKTLDPFFEIKTGDWKNQELEIA